MTDVMMLFKANMHNLIQAGAGPEMGGMMASIGAQ
jgi:hypothetical protein